MFTCPSVTKRDCAKALGQESAKAASRPASQRVIGCMERSRMVAFGEAEVPAADVHCILLLSVPLLGLQILRNVTAAVSPVRRWYLVRSAAATPLFCRPGGCS